MLARVTRRGFKIYTRTGDAGSSSLFNGERRPKDHLIFCALGDTDELNAAIGLARAHVHVEAAAAAPLAPLLPQLDAVQSRLLDMGSAIATPRTNSSAKHLERTAFEGSPEELERWMDAMDETLPPLRNFILPSGGVASASLHVARAVCRRAERSAVPLVAADECDANVATFLNRLSDYLFVAARFTAAGAGYPEVAYQKARAAR